MIFCLKSTNYNYNNEEKILKGRQFLKDIFVKDELVEYILKVISSTLTVGSKLRSILFFISSGRNGKTTFTNMIRHALGDYASNPNVSLFLGKSHGPSLKILQNVYVDLIPIINANNKLIISNLEHALIDRIIVIPFTQRFGNKENIQISLSKNNLNNSSIKQANTHWQGARIQEYSEALIPILIQNYQKDYTNLKIPDDVIKATNDFIIRWDHVARFLETKIIDKKDKYSIPISDPYLFYKNWYTNFISSRFTNYSLEDFRMDLIKYNIRIDKIASDNKNHYVESIIGYRLFE
ncbi:hypothetical protein BCR36DRAFT_368755 [Piromyces finnis]|uniref:SF3 helicase domain-containing protein n=1 Tax=Piromyces finnis TaxID=1754191 RepID=A0A1Y1VFJ5_9FUNG|nr:hypothetical protein BCR36DRAFT_368755 [Piromyces finnis]|eukprot:ORX53721.1 hypothetical protein BCR36DRAFT_368755 [Piromyces finnis]